MAALDRNAFVSPWLAGLVLGAVNGLTVLSLGTLMLPLLVASALLIAGKGPRLIAAAGFLTGAGLIWSVLFIRVALTCGGPFDPGLSTCVTDDLSGWIAGAAFVFAIGLVGSALAFRRLR